MHRNAQEGRQLWESSAIRAVTLQCTFSEHFWLVPVLLSSLLLACPAASCSPPACLSGPASHAWTARGGWSVAPKQVKCEKAALQPGGMSSTNQLIAVFIPQLHVCVVVGRDGSHHTVSELWAVGCRAPHSIHTSPISLRSASMIRSCSLTFALSAVASSSALLRSARSRAISSSIIARRSIACPSSTEICLT